MSATFDANIPHFTIPAVTPHNHYLYVKKEVDAYLSTFARDWKLQNSYDYPLFYSLCYNYSITTERLLNITLLNVFLYEVDDEIEFLGKTNLIHLEDYINRLINAFQFPYMENTETKIKTAIIGVLTKILDKLDAKQSKDLTNTIIDYLKMNLFLFKNLKSKNEYLGLENFIAYRRVDCCVLQMVLLAEYALDYNVDIELPNSPYIQELKILMIDHISISNDIIGVKVEYAKQEIMNYVLANFYELKCSLQEAIDKAYIYFRDTDKQILNLVNFIKNNEKMVRQSPRVIEYVNALMVMCCAHIQWTLETKRHHLSAKLTENKSLKKNDSIPTIDHIIGQNVCYYVLNKHE